VLGDLFRIVGISSIVQPVIAKVLVAFEDVELTGKRVQLKSLVIEGILSRRRRRRRRNKGFIAGPCKSALEGTSSAG
jgi:hypothetical protein